jgi:hypothetical protein
MTAVEGSIPAEMLGKHPAPGPDDEDLPTLEELMREAAVGAEAPQTREEIRRRVTEMFDLESFRRYVGRRPATVKFALLTYELSLQRNSGTAGHTPTRHSQAARQLGRRRAGARRARRPARRGGRRPRPGPDPRCASTTPSLFSWKLRARGGRGCTRRVFHMALRLKKCDTCHK